MPLFCPHCAYLADAEEPFCSRCGHDLVPGDRMLQVRDVPAERHDGSVIVERFRTHCVSYGRRLVFDPVNEVMSSSFSCGQFPGRVDCVACLVCPGCGELLRCHCGALGIQINVKLPPTVEVMGVRARLGGPTV